MSHFKKILFIEDDELTVKLFEPQLLHAGFEVWNVASGRDALIFLQETKIKFDLIILDFVLPGLDGLKLLEELNKRPFTIPVVILTAYCQNEERERAQKFGVREIFVKAEMTIPEIIEGIEEILGKHKAREVTHS